MWDIFNKQELEAENERLRLLLAEREREIAKFIDEQDLFDHIVRVINKEVGFRDVLQSVLKQGSSLIINAQAGAIFLYDERNELFRIESVFGYDPQNVANVLLTKGEAEQRYGDWKYRVKEGLYVIKNMTSNLANPRGFSAKTGQPTPPKAMLTLTIIRKNAGLTDVIGYIVFDNFQDVEAFDDLNLRTITRFREHAVAAFMRATYIQAVEEQSADLQSLDAIVRVVNQESEYDKIIAVVLEQGINYIPQAEKAVYMYWDKRESLFRIGGTYGYDFDLVKDFTFSWEEATERYSMGVSELKDGVYAVNRVDRSRAGGEKLIEGQIPRSMLAMTVVIDGELRGFVVFDNHTKYNAFGKTDLEKLTRFRAHAISALAKARATNQIRQQADFLEQMDGIVKALNREIAFEELIRTLLHKGLELTSRAEKGAFWVLDPATSRYYIAAVDGYTQEEIANITLTEDEIISRYCLNAEKALDGVFIMRPQESNLAADELLKELPRPKAMIAMTVVDLGKTVGVVVYDNFKADDAFKQSDIEKLNRLRDHAVTAFSKARYLREIHRQKK